MPQPNLEQDAQLYQGALSLQRAYELTGISPRTLQRAIQRGALKGIRPPGTRRWYLPPTELHRWLQEGVLGGQQ